MSAILLGLAFVTPLAMLLACLAPSFRARASDWLAVAPVPALLAAFVASGTSLTLPPGLLRIQLSLDLPGAILLGTAAALWIAAAVYAAPWLHRQPDPARFVAWWLLTLAGSIGVFIAADLVSFYLVYSMVSLAAYGLVAEDGTPRARRAGAIYVAFAVLGEAFLLMAFVLLAQATPGDSLLIRDAMTALPAAPTRDAILALLLLGFGAKIGLVPLHPWMPLAYRAAPIPAAAVMSGAAVKAGIIGLIRFLPLDLPLPAWGFALAAVGLLSAFYGVAVGLTQPNPRTVLAYSSVSQMGLMATLFGMGLAEGQGGVAVAAAVYAAHHILAKGTLFLSLDAIRGRGRRAWASLLLTAIPALSLAGLPLTGGAIAKLVMKPPLGDGLVSLLATLSAAGSTALMLHFLRLAVRRAAATEHAPPPEPAQRAAWLAGIAASVAVPWALYLTLGLGTAAYALSPAALWAASWPLILGAVLAAALFHWQARLPSIPPGDIVVLVKAVGRRALAVSEAIDRTEAVLRRWPVAGLALLTLAVALTLALLVGPG